MMEMVPASVWFMGLIGLLVVVVAVARIALMERALHRATSVTAPVALRPEIISGAAAAA